MNFVNLQLQPGIFKVFLYLIHSITDFGVRCFLYNRFPFICICYGIITDYTFLAAVQFRSIQQYEELWSNKYMPNKEMHMARELFTVG